MNRATVIEQLKATQETLSKLLALLPGLESSIGWSGSVQIR
jgi:hypothetical protein